MTVVYLVIECIAALAKALDGSIKQRTYKLNLNSADFSAHHPKTAPCVIFYAPALIFIRSTSGLSSETYIDHSVNSVGLNFFVRLFLLLIIGQQIEVAVIYQQAIRADNILSGRAGFYMLLQVCNGIVHVVEADLFRRVAQTVNTCAHGIPYDKLPNSIQQIAEQGEFNEFDLNVFFKAEGKGKDAHFVFEDYVQKWLDLIRGAYLETEVDELKLGAKRPAMPFSDTRLLNVLSHTLWFLPNVASCFAMKNLLDQKQNAFYHDYKINVCAGTGAGVGLSALAPVQKSMGDPLRTKTITLTCGKLTTGVTVKPWSAIFMLRNLKSPETYFQAAFRVQSPWTIDGEIMKEECYVFDFAINRSLKQIADYSCKLNVNTNATPEDKVEEFVSFLPVIAYDGSSMKSISAAEILDFAMSGTSATLLARRWESALLVNVDNDTLSRLMANPEAMAALMRIEGFRSLNKDIETIINKSQKVKDAKKSGKKPTEKQKKELTEAEKEYKSKRKEIQQKLIKFATRIPIFMYLTDYREQTLHDVITLLEPALFKKVTGLDVKDFELLVSLNVFNGDLMNDAIYKFKRYEDSSLNYTGINKHAGEKVGLFNTVIDYDEMFVDQQASLIAPPIDESDIPEKPFELFADDEPEEIAPVKKPKKEKKNSKNGEVML